MSLSQIVIFGASGDLTARKLVPALVGNAHAGAFKGPVQVVGVARRERSTEAWRNELATWIEPEQREAWNALAPHIHYRRGDVSDASGVKALGQHLDTLAGTDPRGVGRLHYLALKPSLFGPTVEALSTAGMLHQPHDERVGWRRVVVEKPFGTDLQSAVQLNRHLLAHAREEQVYRIDHYLGKETVQNLLAFRFQNAIFEPLWNRDHIESVEISVCESVGMESGRGGYYDTAGALRDMVQNHLLQVLALVAMEAPNSMSADAVRGEKVRALSALLPLSRERVHTDVVRAQFDGYRDEAGVAPDSTTETFVAIRARVHNWRWNGVPFLLRSGKCLHDRYTEVILRFRTPPVDLVGGPIDADVCALRPNELRVLIQPQEGIRLDFLVKQPGPGTVLRPATLGFDYDDLSEAETAPAYQRLLLDAIEGNATLFIRGDETEAAWRFADSIRAGWEAPNPPPVYSYARGSSGPAEADALFRGCEGIWGLGEATRRKGTG